jgi:hypothetical protein
MKTRIISWLVGLTTLTGFSQNVTLNPAVDERTELMSIVFRLAGAAEYMNNDIKTYSDSIDIYFKPHKDDEVIKFAKKLSLLNHVHYDAVMSMAIHMEIDHGIIKLKNNVKQNSLDHRWGNKGDEFVLLLNKFYLESDFHKFYTAHNQLYALAERRFAEIITTTDLTWFERFFGYKPEGTCNLIISLTNGGGNYGTKVQYDNGNEDLFSIMGSWETDSLGFPVYSSVIAETIIHEFCHSFCNQLGAKYYPEMKRVADKFYKLVQDNMEKQAYGSSLTMLNEILVRACVIRYFHAHEAKEMKIKKMTGSEQACGFIWISELVDAMAQYEFARKDYPTLDAYMPQIVKLQNSLSPNELYRTTEANRPRLVSFSIKDKCKAVDPAIKELILTFDRPMYTRAYGMTKGNCGDKCWPKITSVKWTPGKTNELIIAWELEPDHHYSMIFPAPFMMEENGFIMKETYYLDFKTK